MNETMQLAAFVSDFKLEQVSDEVVQAAKNCILDYLGCAVFATKTEVGRIITEYARTDNRGLAAVFPDLEGEGCQSSMAALANGTLAHGFELDDVDQSTVSHPGAVIISAAMALSQERGVSGKKLLEAVIVGYEVSHRIGRCIIPGHLERHHPTGTITVFGAAAACCKILGLDDKHTAWAMGICGSMASGIAQFSISGSMVKRIHAGKAAQQGVMAAVLAEKGFTGPVDILEGAKGFCISYRGSILKEEVDFSILTAGLGEHYAVCDTVFKPTCNCGVLHSVIECLLKCRAEEDFDSTRVEQIVVYGHENLVNGHNVYEPDSILGAQYSLPFTVGMTLVENIWDPSAYLTDDILNNQAVLEMGKKTRTVLDLEMDACFPQQFAAAVELYQTNGRVFRHKVMYQKGTPQNPFTQEELENKYLGLSVGVLGENAARGLMTRAAQLERWEDMTHFFRGL